jgi:hypothetical protein
MYRIKARTNDANAWAAALHALIVDGTRLDAVNNPKYDAMHGETVRALGRNGFRLDGRCYGPDADAWEAALAGVTVVACVSSYATPIAVAVETAEGPAWVAPLEFRSAHSVTTSRHQGTLRRSGMVREVRAADLARVLFPSCTTGAELETATVLWRDGMSLADAQTAAVALCRESVTA